MENVGSFWQDVISDTPGKDNVLQTPHLLPSQSRHQAVVIPRLSEQAFSSRDTRPVREGRTVRFLHCGTVKFTLCCLCHTQTPKGYSNENYFKTSIKTHKTLERRAHKLYNSTRLHPKSETAN
ncbi:hypothetical protein Q8A67_016526 [Cirrhinus molitorella]|uniref:Uncharacterized protein n=1 Tax=Cirrhinus molitorella TaxID=172907 RepID=A0AA88PGV8_9TELE|nr:hypothetical protein Q8A67_016526 [Cirrhinus molitorella]